MVSKVTIEPLHKCFTTLRGVRERACDCITEARAFISPKTAEFLQLEGKSVGNSTDEKILVCVRVRVCASTQ